MIKLKDLLKEDVGRDSYLGGIAQALKKAGIFSRYKKYKVMKGRGVTGRADVGFFITLKDGIVLPLEIRNGYVYYEIEDSHKLGKWADTNKVAQSLKKFSKMDGFGQGKLVKKEGKLTEGKYDKMLDKIEDLVKGAKNLNYHLYGKHKPLQSKIKGLWEVYQQMNTSQYKRAVTIYKKKR